MESVGCSKSKIELCGFLGGTGDALGQISSYVKSFSPLKMTELVALGFYLLDKDII